MRSLKNSYWYLLAPFLFIAFFVRQMWFGIKHFKDMLHYWRALRIDLANRVRFENDVIFKDLD